MNVRGIEHTGRITIRAFLPLCALLVLAPPSQGQVLSGRVVESAGGQPVVSVLLELLDRDSVRVDGTISGADGRYALRAPFPETYSVRMRRLGYRTEVIPAVELLESTVRDLELSAAPVELDGLSASGERRCDGRLEEARQTALLWDLISSALSATSVGEESGLFSFNRLRYRRRTTVDRETILAEGVDVATGDSPFKSVSAERLREMGFVEPMEGGAFSYYMPDPDVLVSHDFIQSHCFSIAEPEDGDESRVGLAFEPVDDRPELRETPALGSHPYFRTVFEDEGADVSGVLWVDRGTGALQRLDYRYVGFRNDDFEELATGYARFEQLSNGAWVVRQWGIRTPELLDTGRRRNRLEATALDEDGGYLISVSDPTGSQITESGSVQLQGRWVPGDIPMPVGGVVVRLSGSDRITRTNPDGSFDFTGIVPGQYMVTYYAAKLDTMGIGARGIELEVGSTTLPDIQLEGPNLKDVREEVCPRMDDDDERGILLVHLEAPEETPIRGRTVVLESADEEVDYSTRRATNSTTLRFCRVPTNVPLVLRSPEWPDATTTVEIPAPFGFARTTLVINPGATRTR